MCVLDKIEIDPRNSCRVCLYGAKIYRIGVDNDVVGNDLTTKA